MKKILLVGFLAAIAAVTLTVSCATQNADQNNSALGDSPLAGQKFEKPQRLSNGKMSDKLKEFYCETDGSVLEDGERVHYYLYNTYLHDGGDGKLLWKCILAWVERAGYLVDYDNPVHFDEDDEGYFDIWLPVSVRRLMRSNQSDVAVSVQYFNETVAGTLVVHNFDIDADSYSTEILDLY